MLPAGQRVTHSHNDDRQREEKFKMMEARVTVAIAHHENGFRGIKHPSSGSLNIEVLRATGLAMEGTNVITFHPGNERYEP